MSALARRRLPRKGAAEIPPTADELASMAGIFAGLSDPTRLGIVAAIRHRERSVGEIAEQLELSEPSVSQHLRWLRSLRVVRLRPEGRRHYYQLDDEHVAALLDLCLEHTRGG